MFHYDPGHAARTSRVFAKLDNQIDEWKKRFGPISASEEILATRRSRESRPELPHTTPVSDTERNDASSTIHLQGQIQWCRREIEAAHALHKRSSDLSSEVAGLKSENALLRQETSETKRRCDQLENALKEVMRTVTMLSMHPTASGAHVATQADRNVTLSVPELLSLVSTGGLSSLAPKKSQPIGSNDADEFTVALLRERIATIENHISADSTKIDRVVDSVTAKVIDALREELLLAGARPREIQARVSARVISQLHEKIPVSATLQPHGMTNNDHEHEAWSFGGGRSKQQTAAPKEVSSHDARDRNATTTQHREGTSALMQPNNSRAGWAEAEKHDFEDREAEHRDDDRRESERREAERSEAERRDNEKREAERRDSEKREAERRENEKREAERRDNEKREAERRDSEKREAERRESEKREAERRESEKREAERRDNEKREAERRDNEKREAERRETERAEALRRKMQRAEDVRREEHQQGAKDDAERQAKDHRAAELLQEERLAVERNMRQALERQQAEMLLEKQNNSHEQHTVASGVADVHDFDGFDVNSEDFEGGVDAQAVQDVEDEDAVDSSESSELLLPGAASANSVRGTTSTASNIEEKQKPIPTSTRVASSRGLANFLSRAVEDDDDFGDHASSVAQPVASNTGFAANPNLNQPVAKNTSTVRSSALRDFSDDFDF